VVGLAKKGREIFARSGLSTNSFSTGVPLTLAVPEPKLHKVEHQLPSAMGESLSKTGGGVVYTDSQQAQRLSYLTLVRKGLECFRGFLLPRRPNVT
jgi:hypothetical protein